MRLNELIKDINIKEIIGEKDIEIKGISPDSNKVKEGYMFVAIKGTNEDGHKYIDSAINSGAAALCLEKNLKNGIENIRKSTNRRKSVYCGKLSVRI